MNQEQERAMGLWDRWRDWSSSLLANWVEALDYEDTYMVKINFRRLCLFSRF